MKQNHKYLSFNYYQKQSRKTAIYPNVNNNLNYVIIGLCGEVGELANKYKKIIRDYNNIINPEYNLKLIQELGDILWYISNIASELNINLSKIALMNLDKLKIRAMNNKLHGEGDER